MDTIPEVSPVEPPKPRARSPRIVSEILFCLIVGIGIAYAYRHFPWYRLHKQPTYSSSDFYLHAPSPAPQETPAAENIAPLLKAGAALVAQNGTGYEIYHSHHDTKGDPAPDYYLYDENIGKDIFVEPIPVDDEYVQSMYFDKSLLTLFLIVSDKPYASSSSGLLDRKVEKIVSFTEIPSQGLAKKELWSREVELYTTTSIEHFFSPTKFLLLSLSGDGCGSAGNLFILDNSVQHIISPIGSGCVPEKLPRYAGSSDTTAYLYTFDGNQPDEETLNQEEYPDPSSDIGNVNSIFSIDLTTKQKQNIATPEQLQNVVDVTFDEQGQTFTLYLRGKGTRVLNLQTKK